MKFRIVQKFAFDHTQPESHYPIYYYAIQQRLFLFGGWITISGGFETIDKAISKAVELCKENEVKQHKFEVILC